MASPVRNVPVVHSKLFINKEVQTNGPMTAANLMMGK